MLILTRTLTLDKLSLWLLHVESGLLSAVLGHHQRWFEPFKSSKYPTSSSFTLFLDPYCRDGV